MDDAAFKAKLARLRAHRNARGHDMSLGGVLVEQRRSLRRTTRAGRSMDEVWRAIAPPQVAEHSRVLSFARGVLTVRITDEGVRFHADRWLRAGGLGELTTAAPATLARVRFVFA